MKKLLNLFGLLLLLTDVSFSQENNLLSFVHDGKVYLRWMNDLNASNEGFNVYRKTTSSEWQKINSTVIQPVFSIEQIRKIAKYKTPLYLSLFNADEKLNAVSKEIFFQKLNDKNAGPFIGAISMVNHEFGTLLGVVFCDSSDLSSPSVQYKITAIGNGNENDWAVSSPINKNSPEAIPSVENFSLGCKSATASLKWTKNESLMKKGGIVTYHVHRATNILGPYEQIDYTGILPVTISSGAQKSETNVQSYSDEYLNNGTAYYYYITSVNAFGFESLPGTTLSCTPQSGGTSPVKDLHATPYGKFVKLEWNGDADGLKGFAVYRSSDPKKSFQRVYPLSDVLLHSMLSWIDMNVSESAHYYYFVQSVGNDQLQINSDTVQFSFPDNAPPAAPKNVKATISNNTIIMTWDKNTEKDLLGYEVDRASDDSFKAMFKLNGKLLQTNSYSNPVPKESPTKYGYVVLAVDQPGNKSLPSKMVYARMPDHTPPPSPIITLADIDSNQVKLKWAKITEKDFAKYRVYRYQNDPAKKKMLNETRNNFINDRPNVNGTYNYIITAVDSSKNESAPSKAVKIIFTITEPLPAPANFQVKKTDDKLVLTWSIPASKTVSGFVITRKNLASGTTILLAQIDNSRQLSLTDQYADVNKSYEYRITSFDKDFKMSEEILTTYVPK